MTQLELPKYREVWPRGNVDFLDGVADLVGVAIDIQPIAVTFDRETFFQAGWFGPVTSYVDDDGVTHSRRSWRTAEPLDDTAFPDRRDHVLVFCQVTDDPTIPLFFAGKLQLI